LPGYALTGVLDNASAFGNEPRGVNAATVHAGFANFDASVWTALFNFTFVLVSCRKATPRLRRLSFASVREMCNSDPPLASPDID
jgi:hypothetical protein